MRAGKPAALALAFGVAALAGTGASAHRLDECLQAARIAIEPGRVEIELDLTPGAAAADRMIASIDRDGDGSFSMAEQRLYVDAVVGGLALRMDGRALRVDAGTSTFADAGAMRRGEGMIRLRTGADLPPLPAGEHRLLFRNGFAAEDTGDLGNVYLANALVPESDRVTVTAQQRDTAQRVLGIDYVLLPEQRSTASAWLAGGLAAALIAAVWMRRPTSGALRAALRHS